MDIRVSGHQVDTGEALKTRVEDRLNAISEKFFSKAISAHTTFGKAPGGAFSADIVMHVMHGLTVKASAEEHDAHQAFDQAAQKVEKQLRRYKRRLNDRHQQSAHALVEEEASYRVFDAIDEEGESEELGDSPPIVAETRVDVPEASVSDAVMMLDLRDTNALMFKNAGTGTHNMVYRRRDGSIGWVEPS